ncbi:MAG: MBL fold metallo-hydrolase [Candidatus Bipolaricaulota bacterium]|nr:MBL fold metallo-hydrolase [Candidatus Bipolaricaulota bacterium]
MKLTFCGAAKTVTGSCHLVETNGLKILLDCGLFQGSREIEERNRQAFPFAPDEIDFVLLSHAHLDHVGRIPILVRRGFRGQVITTLPTIDIAKVILTDSAHIQVEEAAYRARKARRHGDKARPPLYDVGDVLDSLSAFRDSVDYEAPIALKDDVDVIFHEAGHILGSAAIELRTAGKTLLYSGDLGNRHRPIVRDPAPPPRADAVLIESTYGDRDHRSMDESVAELRGAVRTVIGRGGNLLIPSFALERTQEILYELFLMWQEGGLPQCDIYLDSPLAIATTRIFSRYPEYFDSEGQEVFSHSPTPFDFPPLSYSQTTLESRQINAQRGGAIIIAGSGMCSGGRIIHHLKHNLWREKSGIVFVGYQARGTLGRQIIEGANRVKIFGEEIQVRAQRWTVNGFSAHADQGILLDWLGKTEAENIFLLHGEEESLNGFAEAIGNELSMKPYIPSWKEAVKI